MTQKYTVNDFTVFVTFKTQNSLSIIACNSIGLENYGNQNIELMKIKKDTIRAALQKKNQKNISCQFSYEKNPNQVKPLLILTIKVKYEFLPEFAEQIRLSFMKEKTESMTKVQSCSFQNDINQIQKMLDCLEKADSNQYNLSVNLVFSEGTNVCNFKADKGKHLLQMSGFCNSPTGTAVNSHLNFRVLHSDGEKMDMPSFRPYITSSYSYPYNISELIEIKKPGEVSVRCLGNVANLNIQNNFTLLTPVIDFQD